MPADRIRGAADVPLNTKGLEEAQRLSQRLNELGGLDRVYSGTLGRVMDTAGLISPSFQPNPALNDMAYGRYEGAHTADAIHAINDYILRFPNTPIPDVGRYSGQPGESFNSYKQRVLGQLHSLMKSWKDPEKVGVVVNRRTIKTVEGWLKAGGDPSFAANPEIITSYTDGDKQVQPASMFALTKKAGRWRLNPADPFDPAFELNPGLYLIRHGETDWNGLLAPSKPARRTMNHLIMDATKPNE